MKGLTHLAKERSQWTIMKFWVPHNMGNFLISRAAVVFSRWFLLSAVGVFSGSQICAVAMFMLLIRGTHDIPNWRYRMIWFLAGVHENRCIIIWCWCQRTQSLWVAAGEYSGEMTGTALCCVWSSGIRDVATTPVFIQMSCSHVWGAWAAGRGYGFDSYVPCLVHRFTGHCTLCVTMKLLYSVACRRTCCVDILL